MRFFTTILLLIILCNTSPYARAVIVVNNYTWVLQIYWSIIYLLYLRKLSQVIFIVIFLIFTLIKR